MAAFAATTLAPAIDRAACPREVRFGSRRRRAGASTTRRLAVLAALLATSPAIAVETVAVVAVAEPPAGPDADLAELAHQLRAACRDRVGGVQDVPAMRARLLGPGSDERVAELDRAYGAALAMFQNGEFESAIRTLESIVDDLERVSESDASYAQWVRAQLRLAHAALTIGREREAEEAMLALARTDPGIQPEPDQYSPSYRRRLEQVKAKVRTLPLRTLQVRAEGAEGTVFVNGRAMGATPIALSLPAGSYRIGGASGTLHVPSFRVDLQRDRAVVLDFELGAAVRPHGGPGLALAGARRRDGLVRAGAWLDVDRVVAVGRGVDGNAQLLLGSIHDVRSGALLREGAVRMDAGSVPAARMGALAAFLVSGQSSREVDDRTAAARARAAPASGDDAARERAPALPAHSASAREPTPLVLPAAAEERRNGRARWVRRAAYGSAILVGVFAGAAIQQGLAARDAGARADRMVAPDGFLAGGSDPSRYQDLRADARSASRNAYVSGGAAVVFAVATGVLGWKSRAPDPGPALAFRF